MHCYEIFLAKNFVSKEEWSKLINIIAKYNGYFQKFYLDIINTNNEISYFLKTRCHLPPSINELNAFVIKESDKNLENIHSFKLFIYNISSNFINLIEYIEIKNKGRLERAHLSFKYLANNKILSNINIIIRKGKLFKKYHLPIGIAPTILSLNFEENKRYIFRKVPKYLDITKAFHILNTDKTNALLKVETFPYLQGDFYLNQSYYNFDKHSIVFGSSGSGKSKFLSSFIKNIYNNQIYKQKYKVVVIDPHASLENDIGGIGKVIDFKQNVDSTNLFSSSSNDIIANTELFIDLLKSLLNDNYNAKTERVLRHSIYLLLANKSFNFTSLRNLLLDLEFRNKMINYSRNFVPNSVINFFLTDFNEIKTKSYNEAISPIIAFIDEMQMIPVFNSEENISSIKDIINDNFLTIFSLDRTKIGDKVTKTISGLIMQQLMVLIENHSFNEHIIFIIDEVAIIENPILSKYLSEARKYNLSLILAGQYFNQISSELKDSIFANVINYYIFRVSRLDASILANNFNMKVPLDDTIERKIKILSELKSRECIIRINKDGVLIPAIKAKTLDFESIPRQINRFINIQKDEPQKKEIKKITIGSANLKEILIKTSSSRKEIINE